MTSVSVHTINRIPEMLQLLNKLKLKGHDFVSLETLADLLKLKPKMILTDLNSLNIHPTPLRVYKTKELIKELEKISGQGIPQEYINKIISNHDEIKL